MTTEEDAALPASWAYPRVSEATALERVERRVRVSVAPLPPTVHGQGEYAFVPHLITLARAKGVSACVGEEDNRWPAVHRSDAARLYRLTLERGTAAGRYRAVAEKGVQYREIAALIGRRLGVPLARQTSEEAARHFGWFAEFASLDAPASSARTGELCGWTPSQPGLLADLHGDHYFPARRPASQAGCFANPGRTAYICVFHAAATQCIVASSH